MTMSVEVELSSAFNARFRVEFVAVADPRGILLRLVVPKPTTLSALLPCHAKIAPATKTVPLFDAVTAVTEPSTKGAPAPSRSAQSPFEGIQIATPGTFTGDGPSICVKRPETTTTVSF